MTEPLVALPSPELQAKFNGVIQPLRDLLNLIPASNGRLLSILELLIPKLVSGQIEVSKLDLDAVVGSVA
jgi:type I restriction enzyme S subunit